MTRRGVTSNLRIACPGCRATTIAKVLDGYPAFSRKLDEDLAASRIALGGCVMSQGQPDVACTTCGLEFRTDGRPVGELAR